MAVFYRLCLSVADLSLAALAIDHVVYVNAGESIHPITSLSILHAQYTTDFSDCNRYYVKFTKNSRKLSPVRAGVRERGGILQTALGKLRPHVSLPETQLSSMRLCVLI